MNIIGLYTQKDLDGIYNLSKQLRETRKENENLQQELQRKDNNWNELKGFILNHYIVGHKVQNSSLDMIINKTKDLENEYK